MNSLNSTMMIGRPVFRTVQSGKEEEMYRVVTDSALYLATAGHLEEANALLLALWKHELPHDPNTWLADQAFEVLWGVAGTRPDYVPFASIPLDDLEKEHRHYLGGDHYAYPMPPLQWQDLPGKHAFRQAQIWFPFVEKDPDTLGLLEKALQQCEELAPYEFASATVMAAELAAKAGDEALATRMARWWAEKYHQYYLNYNFPLLAGSRHLAPILLEGILAQALKITKAESQAFVAELTAAVDKRVAEGRSLVYGNWPWKKLLRRLSKAALAEDAGMFSAHQIQAGWIGREGGAKAAITAAERRLGLTLPEDYKQFLRISNGLPAFPLLTPELLPVEEIDYYQALEEEELYHITKTTRMKTGRTLPLNPIRKGLCSSAAFPTNR
jgi:hypothetical protein